MVNAKRQKGKRERETRFVSPERNLQCDPVRGAEPLRFLVDWWRQSSWKFEALHLNETVRHGKKEE